jgi:hypothetical protein
MRLFTTKDETDDRRGCLLRQTLGAKKKVVASVVLGELRGALVPMLCQVFYCKYIAVTVCD